MVFIQQMLHAFCFNRSNARAFLGQCTTICWKCTMLKIIAIDWHSSTIITFEFHQNRDLSIVVAVDIVVIIFVISQPACCDVWFHYANLLFQSTKNATLTQPCVYVLEFPCLEDGARSFVYRMNRYKLCIFEECVSVCAMLFNLVSISN